VIYASSIVCVKGGTEGTLVKTVLPVTSGLLWLFEIDFPPGCCGLAHVRMFDGGYQVFPATPGESFHGDNFTIHLEDLYFKTAAPFEFIIETWNEDEIWDHDLQIRVGIAMTRAEMSRYIPALAFENFEQLMAETMARQEQERQIQLEATLKLLTGE